MRQVLKEENLNDENLKNKDVTFMSGARINDTRSWKNTGFAFELQCKDGKALEIIKEYNPDVIVVAAYGKILPSYVLDYPKHGCINVHGSILPKYRGAAPIQRAIIDGEKVQIRLVWFNKVRYADESLPIITLDLSMLGLSGIYQQFAIAQAPNLDSVLPLSIANNGIITLTDTIYKGSAPTALNSQCSVTFDLQFAPSSMLDSACDEFVWKRTA